MFLQSYLSYNIDVKDTYLSAEGYYPETEDETTATKITDEVSSSSLKKERI